ncbi:hypothetical protein Cfor_07885 [Coptotermes formosanus]|uniref:Uncharacterized protein n=1 Tax=Coptotermes formosanus TaxID=36987 RepID=A0A6L2P7T7_COPFO|nr:hypothetical protein Cfor_07885 [Coptotermes formosanus]
MNTGDVAENRSLAAQHLTLRVKLKHRELEYCSFLIENCLYLIWCHLDYYMLRSLPRGFPQTVPSHVLTQGITELVWVASPQEISQLKQGLISIFSDSFSRRLIDTKQCMYKFEVADSEVVSHNMHNVLAKQVLCHCHSTDIKETGYVALRRQEIRIEFWLGNYLKSGHIED